jgi:hypothetical protein
VTSQPWRVLILDRDPEDPKWIMATVESADHVMPALLDSAGRYSGWGDATRWVAAQSGSEPILIPVMDALAWKINTPKTDDTIPEKRSDKDGC